MILNRLQSLRARLLLGVVAGMVLLLVASSVAIYVLQRRALMRRFDQAITSTARALVPLLRWDDRLGVHMDPAARPLPEFQRSKGPDYFQIWRADGTVAARSPTLGNGDLPTVMPGDKPARYDCMLPRDERGRAVLLKADVPRRGPPDGGPPTEKVTIVVAKETEPVRNDLRTLAWILLGTTVGGAALAGGLAWAVVARGLRPLARMARQISQVEPSALGQRIDPSGLPAELQPVATRLNAMLDRLQAAFDRERGFTADVAHEFRNPLAAIRSVGEVALASPQSADEYLKDIGEMVALARGMQGLVEKLLLLARLDAGQVTVERTRVDAGRAVQARLAENGPELAKRGVTLDNQVPVPLELPSADPQLVALALSNVIENAVTYVNEGGRISVSAAQQADGVAISVANSGCQLDEAQVQRVFDRFWRGDASRSATGTHAGLGLSLAQRAVVAMGGRIEAAVYDGTFTVRVHFPA